jgi:O-antigen ligase
MSYNRHWELTELKRYVHVFIAGFLFTAPMSDKNRNIIIIFFFLCAAIAGIVGILQFTGLLINPDPLAPHGLSPHPILYAAMLAFACGLAIIMLFFRENELFQSRTGKVILLVTILLTFGGIIASESRGVWIALVAACTVTLFLYDRKKTLIFFCAILTAMTLIFFFNNTLRQRAASIVTSFYTENEKGSTGNRLELWKGSLMIFKERPLLGTGIGNFESNIKRLISEKKLKEIPYTMHAHNIFLQAMVTRGIIGFVITIGFFATLIKWGMKEIREHGGIGGYTIILCSVLTIVGGLTENNIENGKFLAALCLTIGLIGPHGTDQRTHNSIS